ncbi:MAG: DNA-binding protein HU 1 [Candidatus Izimaplasma bacterium HR2]|nr:MAG: DNA-binding protein HU 1 [Candidatus Izimaplasma bacterium HR2]
MSKTELLYNKILKVSMFSVIISFVLLIIDLFFAVTQQAIICNGTLNCSIDSSKTFFQVTIWFLGSLVVIFVILARVMVFLLSKEDDLESATAYKLRMKEEASSDFSESKLYEDIKENRINAKTKKAKRAKKPKKTRTYPNVGEMFRSALNSTKEFFSSVITKLKEQIATFKDKRNIRKAENAVHKHASDKEKAIQKKASDEEKAIQRKATDEEKAVQKKAKDEEKAVQKKAKDEEKAAQKEVKEAEKVEKAIKHAAEKEVELARKAELAKAKAIEKAELAKQVAIDKESRKKEALIVAQTKNKDKKEITDSIKESSDKNKLVTSINKAELISLAAQSSSLTKVKCKLVINSLLDIIVEEISNSNEVNIGKFGKFKVVTNKSKKGVNPKTGETIVIPESNEVRFLPDKLFKDMIITDSKPISDLKAAVTKEPEKQEKSNKQIRKEEKEAKLAEEEAKRTAEKEVKLEEEKQAKLLAEKEAKLEEKRKTELAKQEELANAAALTKKKAEAPKVVKPAKPKELKKTKADIIVYIEEKTGISKNKSNKFLKFFAEVVKEELAKGKDIDIPGFGTFTTIKMPAKDAVNPQTNKKIVVPSHRQARLRFDDKFKKNFEPK